jgi:hypothetical protein
LSAISSNLSLVRSSDAPTPAQQAQQALRRLDLRPAPGREFGDLVRLDASSLQVLTRQLEAEWDRLDSALQRGNIAVARLMEVEESLAELQKLVQSNTRPGTAAAARKSNQKQIDTLLGKIDQAIKKSVDSDGERVFLAEAPLVAGKEKLPLDAADSQTLGKSIVRGRQVGLMDLASRKAHDTSIRRNPAAGRLVAAAMDTVQALRKDIEVFVRQKVHPRLADVAEVTAGLMHTLGSQTIGTGEEAMRLARELRVLTLKSTATATAIGAEGWDRARIEKLLT